MATSLAIFLEQNSALQSFQGQHFSKLPHFQQLSTPFLTLYLQGHAVKQVSEISHIKNKISQHTTYCKFMSKPLAGTVHPCQKASLPQV